MRLLYLGASIANNLANPLANNIRFCDHQELQNLKLGHDEYARFLDLIKTNTKVKQLALVSTCNRFELFIYAEEIENLAQELPEQMASLIKTPELLSCLFDDDARLHFYRTFCGLNSGLIGEGEVCLQIETSFRQCFTMGYLGVEGVALLESAKQLKQALEESQHLETSSYCKVAIDSVIERLTKLPDSVVVLGSGSTAMQSCLALIDAGISASQITLVHRTSSSSYQVCGFNENNDLSKMQFIRSKDGYHVTKVKELVMSSDMAIFAIDSRLPVFNIPKNLKTVLVDFNSHPSVTFEIGIDLMNYFSCQRLDKFIREYSSRILANPDKFKQIQAVEERLAQLRSSDLVHF